MRWSVGDRRSLTHTFTREEIAAFADLTGDTNPVHVDAAYANRTAAGGPVVHGMLAAAFVSTLIGMQLPGPGALWNSFQVNWRRMVRIGDTMRFEATVTAVHAATRTLDLQVTGVHAGSGDVYLEGTARVMMMEERAPAREDTLSGKRVLVTGASGEIGGAICRALAAAGCSVVAWGRNADRLRALADQVGGMRTQAVDLFQDAQIAAALPTAAADGMDGFVHAAAAPLKIAELGDSASREQLGDQWQVDVNAFHQIVQGLIPHMANGGFITTVLTQAVFDAPPPKMSGYVAAKSGAWGLVRAMAVELGPKGIRCNAVSPSLIETPYVKDMPVRVKQIEAATNPLRRLCTVEDVSNAVVFLAGPQAAFVNGVNLPVNGGARMH